MYEEEFITENELRAMTIKELQEICFENGYEGYQKLSKAQLIEFILNSEGEDLIYPDTTVEWMIYGHIDCGYTREALKLLNKNKLKYIFIDYADLNISVEEFMKEMGKLTRNYKTVPMIFHWGKFIGGYAQLKTYF